MSIGISPAGFLMDLWTKNRKGEQVFPHIKVERDSVSKGIAVTLTGRKEDYHLVSLDQFLRHIAAGDFDKVGRVRMKPLEGGKSNGFAVRKLTMSPLLKAEIEEMQK